MTPIPKQLSKIENLEGEIWKDIEGYESHYEISNMGRIISYKPDSNISIRTMCYDNKGYLRAKLSINGISKTHKVHRLVAIHFVPNPDNKPQVNHINMIKDDNRSENLEWNTNKENQYHCRLNKKDFNVLRGEKSGTSILKEFEVYEIRKLCMEGILNQIEIANIYKISPVTVSAIKNRRIWKHI